MVEIDEYYRSISNRLGEELGWEEGKKIAFLLLSELYGISRIDLIMNKEVEVDEEAVEKMLSRLLRHEPIQYVLGRAWFDGMTLAVTADTLIPRPETEELVEWIAQEEAGKGAVSVLDIGTGSGCIPLALKRRMPNAVVEGIDISKGALNIARANAERLGLEVAFHEVDILSTEGLPKPSYDVLVSNPPYVRPSEQLQMEANVLDYEPHQALFIPEEKPLLFYERIAILGRKSLKKGGGLYFEINEAFGAECMRLLEGLGYESVSLKKDMQGKDRMLRAISV